MPCTTALCSPRTRSCKLRSEACASRQAENAFEKNQLNQLRQLMALKNLPSINQLPTVTAQTQEVDSSNFTMTITIDKGGSDGVDVGMPVVGAGGLVGQVIQSFHHTAVVQLVNDGQSKVGVTFGKTQTYTATVDGQGPDSSMTADLVPPHTPLHKGEIMYTSSFDAARLSSRHPRGPGDVVPHRAPAPVR